MIFRIRIQASDDNTKRTIRVSPHCSCRFWRREFIFLNNWVNFFLVSSLTIGSWLSTLETVDLPTPQSLAISLIVNFLLVSVMSVFCIYLLCDKVIVVLAGCFHKWFFTVWFSLKIVRRYYHNRKKRILYLSFCILITIKWVYIVRWE